jgi:NAD(P)-dependent dehydrogenase (short-subunit alcohol dehydrogenase family)
MSDPKQTAPSSPADGNVFRLDDRVAIITGGTGLLGLQHAAALAAQGARVIISDRDQGRCDAEARKLKDGGLDVVGRACDVSNPAAWKSLLDFAMSSYGRVDVLVNNAAFTSDSRSAGYGKPFEEYALEDWQQIMDVNLTGTFLGCQTIGPHMVGRGSGSIINVSSMYGIVSPHHDIYEGTGVSQPVAYSVSKAGVLGITRYLATLWARDGVRVNTITPGGVFNKQHPLFLERYNALSPIGRMAHPHEMSGAIVFLASDAASYCTGQNLIVDGGWSAW